MHLREQAGAKASVDSYPLLDALLGRRSRRFAAGAHLGGGPLAYRSEQSPQPLSIEEEALLAFAACGITGPDLADLPFAPGELPEAGGNIMVHLTGRTVPSGDAIHTVTVFVTNDEGTWLLNRPQDFSQAEVSDLLACARDRRWADMYENSRVRVAPGRVDVPREWPVTPGFNRWSANVPGSTYVVPVNELSALYINALLAAFSEDAGLYALDEKNGFRPAGVAKFARSRGGHLNDDPGAGRVVLAGVLEASVCEFAAIEQGGILQNLGLMTQALGLGGFAHFAAHPFAWFQALGFRTSDLPVTRTFGSGPVVRTLAKLLRKDMVLPTAVGLERDGEVLIRSYCPPYYRDMEQAVLALVEHKYAQGKGTLRDGGAGSAWLDGRAVQEGIPAYSDRAIEATIAYCRYIYERYGRFPAISGPFRTILAYQAHHLDLDFYESFYHPEALTETQRTHQADWHSART